VYNWRMVSRAKQHPVATFVGVWAGGFCIVFFVAAMVWGVLVNPI
jgi:hypothetical protein